MEKVTVKVAWCGKNFGGAFGENIPGAVVFTAPSVTELHRVARETLEFHVAGLVEDGQQVPRWLQDGDYCLTFEFEDVAAMLHACESYVSLAAISRASGVSQGLLSHYANGLKKPRPEQRSAL